MAGNRLRKEAVYCNRHINVDDDYTHTSEIAHHCYTPKVRGLTRIANHSNMCLGGYNVNFSW